ncbi:response regulator [Acidovorax sp. A1169]|jgi:CheY-like chemotaxis protein|uniref:response regulator n=1 Tax=Acidovorax sp. A1169 TaxID=3059524 RepID=UPI0027377E6B|nr:response regulator [Acidovorax sp. A1169]MDP4075102.1 response regulator [Acidovorax sp. A1169]
MTTLSRVLLVEPQFVLRRTIAMVGRDLGIVDFHEASSVGRARTLLMTDTFAGLVLDLQEGQQALDLISDIRRSQLAPPNDLRIVVLAADLLPGEASRLQELQVQCVLTKPLRISDLLKAIVVPK